MNTSSKSFTVEHVTRVCEASFDEVHASILAACPTLDPNLVLILQARAVDEIARRREAGPNLWLFLTRDHGGLLAAERRPGKAIQYEIGNPLTAERMTRHQLPAALYAPLRVLLYEDNDGRAILEYDRPSSLFGQFEDDEVDAVGRELDEELESVLLSAAA